MHSIGLCVLLLLSSQGASSQIAKTKIYYFLEDGIECRSTNTKEIYGKDFDKIVVDLNTTSFVDYVWIHFAEGRLIDKRVSVYESTIHAPTQCRLDERPGFFMYTCNCAARIILLEGEGTIENMTIKSTELKMENYVGCFNSSEDGVASKDPDDCNLKCAEASYYGIKPDGKCICITNLHSIEEAKFLLCNRTCSRSPHHLCGSSDYFSVYSKDDFHKNRAVVGSMWKCIYNRIGCPRCTPGTFGFNCERTECSTSNGNCAEMPCGSYLVAKSMLMYSVCMCAVESRHDDHLQCGKGTGGCTDVVCINGECAEDYGDFKCVCHLGFYRFAKKMCVDMDECSLADVCPRGTVCANNIGNYECTCTEGHTRDEGKSDKSICRDIDECEFSDIFCPRDVLCINLPGSWDCACSKGTTKVKFFLHIECEDIDECENIGSCNLTSSFCINTKASYACACIPGYQQVDNFTCASKKKDSDTTQHEPDETTSIVRTGASKPLDLAFVYLLLFGIMFLLVTAILMATVCIFLTKHVRKPSVSSTRSKVSDLD